MLDGDIYVVVQHLGGHEVLDGDIYVVVQHLGGHEVLNDNISRKDKKRIKGQ